MESSHGNMEGTGEGPTFCISCCRIPRNTHHCGRLWDYSQEHRVSRAAPPAED
ncbi:unnamed protein product [Prunus armeniaca]|uniref:Uncharacterized protein n=1 Tax=Prunus armeniaca TaxID=36596 RepID=A0A6J5W8G7_PRUAR|nr:unnamed protein product [Prunus armeniaca]CAB4297836.1 unnamed protein product [Prunus armeniaca]